jgi:hypothetical protein
MCNASNTVLGKRDADFFPRHLAENYTRDGRCSVLENTTAAGSSRRHRQDDQLRFWQNANKRGRRRHSNNGRIHADVSGFPPPRVTSRTKSPWWKMPSTVR